MIEQAVLIIFTFPLARQKLLILALGNIYDWFWPGHSDKFSDWHYPQCTFCPSIAIKHQNYRLCQYCFYCDSPNMTEKSSLESKYYPSFNLMLNIWSKIKQNWKFSLWKSALFPGFYLGISIFKNENKKISL